MPIYFQQQLLLLLILIISSLNIMENSWEQKTRQSHQKIGNGDSYNIRTPLPIQDYKEISEEVLPIILNIIEKESSHSGRPLQLHLGKPTTMQAGIKLVLVAVRPLHRHSCPTSPSLA